MKEAEASEAFTILSVHADYNATVEVYFNRPLEHTSMVNVNNYRVENPSGRQIAVNFATFDMVDDYSYGMNTKVVLFLDEPMTDGKYSIQVSNVRSQSSYSGQDSVFFGSRSFSGIQGQPEASFYQSALRSDTEIDLIFRAPIMLPSAENLSNYTLYDLTNNQQLVISKVKRNPDFRKIRVTVSAPFKGNTVYKLSFAGLQATSNSSNIGASADIKFVWTSVNQPVPPFYKVNRLQAIPGDRSMLLQWQAFDGHDISAYRIYQAGQKVAELPADRTDFRVTGLLNGMTYNFSITAVNSYGNESALAPFYAEQPTNKLELVNVWVVDDSKVKLTFNNKLNAQAANEAANYGIKVVSTLDQPILNIQQALLQSDGYSVILHTASLNGNKQYIIYKVALSNESGEAVAIHSESFGGIPLDNIPPYAPTTLKLTESAESRVLSWLWYGDNDVAKFRIYAGTELQHVLAASERQVIITEFNRSTGQRYSISAVDENGNESDRYIAYVDTVNPAPSWLAIDSVAASTNSRIVITFNQPIDLEHAQNKSNYAIKAMYGSTDLEILSATRMPDPSKVVLITAVHPSSSSLYELSVSNLVSASGHEIWDKTASTTYVSRAAIGENGFIVLYTGREGSALQRFILSHIDTGAMNQALSGLKFRVVSSFLPQAVDYSSSDVILPQENGRLYKIDGNRLIVEYTIPEQFADGDTLEIVMKGYKSAVAGFSATDLTFSASILYPGDVSGVSQQPDGQIDLLDYADWLTAYKRIASDPQSLEGLRMYDFSKDGYVNNLDFSLWQSAAQQQ